MFRKQKRVGTESTEICCSDLSSSSPGKSLIQARAVERNFYNCDLSVEDNNYLSLWTMKFTVLYFLVAIFSNCQCLINTDVFEAAQELHQHEEKTSLSLDVHKKIYSYTKNIKAFKNLTFEETAAYMNELHEWEAPRDIQEQFAYALLGYDYERRPVWYDPVGSQNIRKAVEEGRYHLVEKFWLQSFIRIMQSIQAADLPGDEIRKTIVIWDMDGFSMRQVGHLPTVAALVRSGRRYGDIPLEFLEKAILINANYVTKLAYDMARPLLGRLLENVEVYGGNRNNWLPRFLKLAPYDIVPPWLGGDKNNKPLNIHG